MNIHSFKALYDKLPLTIATLGPVGHFPKAPGTWGSLAAVIGAPWLFLPFSLWNRLFILAGLFIVGTWACSRAETTMKKKDPGCVVIDEVFGQWLTLLFFTGMPIWTLGIAFLLFRLFDIVKPWPVKQAETTFSSGLGVMIDDGVAGLYALIGLELFAYFFI